MIEHGPCSVERRAGSARYAGFEFIPGGGGKYSILMQSLLADAILLIHFAFVLFVLGGLLLIWTGAVLGWKWVRYFWFRIAHLAAIVFVALESLVGVWCPLTVWEDALRGTASDKSFIARWVHRVMFFQLPEWMFTVAYVLFAAVVVLTFLFIAPEKRRSR